MSQYTVDYFIDKFSAIPEDRWCTNQMNGMDSTHCAYGHLSTEERVVIPSIFATLGLRYSQTVFGINDDFNPNYKQPSPKQRILAALNDIKQLQLAQS